MTALRQAWVWQKQIEGLKRIEWMVAGHVLAPQIVYMGSAGLVVSGLAPLQAMDDELLIWTSRNDVAMESARRI